MKWQYLIISTIVLLQGLYLFGQKDTLNFEAADTVKIDLSIFESDDPVEINLTFNIKEFQKKKHQGEYVPARLSFLINDSLLVEKKLRIKARGNFRRTHCVFPPFWLNLKKRDLRDTSLYAYKKLKIVSHCRNTNDYSEYILKEYLAYRMYNIITDYSFRASLLKINYIDLGRKGKKTTTWAIAIEPEEMLADRTNCFPMKNDHLGLKFTDSLQTDIMAFFQFMIGNGDYSIAGRHNIKLIKIKDYNKIYPLPIPYDFDYCGFINTSYAIPGENLGIKTVRDRYYLGACRTDEEYNEALQVFKDKKDELLNLIKEFDYLPSKTREDALLYIESFYEKTKRENFFDFYMRSTCR